MLMTILTYLSVFAFMYFFLIELHNIAGNCIRAIIAIHEKIPFKTNFYTVNTFIVCVLAVLVFHFWH